MAHEKTEKTFEDLRETNPREAGEYAYALGKLNMREGNTAKAEHFGQEAIRLFDQCSMNSLEDCAGRNIFIEDIPIPGLIHQDVVRNNLEPLKL